MNRNGLALQVNEQLPVQISLEQSTFTSNTAEHPELLADANVTFYGDATSPLVCTYPPFDGSNSYNLTCQLSRPRPLSEAGAAAGFLTGTDEWLVRAEQVRCMPLLLRDSRHFTQKSLAVSSKKTACFQCPSTAPIYVRGLKENKEKFCTPLNRARSSLVLLCIVCCSRGLGHAGRSAAVWCARAGGEQQQKPLEMGPQLHHLRGHHLPRQRADPDAVRAVLHMALVVVRAVPHTASEPAHALQEEGKRQGWRKEQGCEGREEHTQKRGRGG